MALQMMLAGCAGLPCAPSWGRRGSSRTPAWPLLPCCHSVDKDTGEHPAHPCALPDPAIGDVELQVPAAETTRLPNSACEAYQRLGRGCKTCNDMAVSKHDRLRAGAESQRWRRSLQSPRPCSEHMQHHTCVMQRCGCATLPMADMLDKHPCSARDKPGQALP